MRKTSITLLMASAALALSACAKKAPEVLPPPPADTPPPPAPTPTPTPTPTGPIPGSQADFIASVAADRVFFAFDKSDIDEESMATLKSQASWLMQHPDVKVTIEGHCDERGTRDYNIALGERRANAAKNYLASLGIDPSRMNTISYGKENPDPVGSNEEAWAKNRRAVTVVVE